MMNYLYKLLDSTLGRVTRLIYRITVLPFLYSTHPRLDQLLERNAIDASAIFASKNLSQAMLFKNRFELWNFALRECGLTDRAAEDGTAGIALEFGVFKGVSINQIGKLAKNSRVFGFDSFEGLKENWYGTKRSSGYFNTSGSMPEVRENIKLIKGWFDKTLPTWIEENSTEIQNISFVHLDCDTYPSTKFLLSALVPICSSETVYVFDEYLGYPGWENGEHLAAVEVADQFQKQIRYIAFGGQSVAVKFL